MNYARERRPNMRQLLKAGWLAVFFLLAVATTGLPAYADNVTFGCVASGPNVTQPNPCSGFVGTDGADYWTSGIDVFNANGPYSSGDIFTLQFNTAFPTTISISGSGVLLEGTINSFSVVAGAGGDPNRLDIYLDVTWTNLPFSVQTILGTAGGFSPYALVVSAFRTTTSYQSEEVSVVISPTPEPTTMVLFGSGLLICAGLLKRKLRHKA